MACVEDLVVCSNECLTTVRYCLERGGGFIQPAHIQGLMDCAHFCQAAISGLLTDPNEAANGLLHACAEAAVRCAETCERMTRVPQMQVCAEACRSAAASCQDMVYASARTVRAA
jgi:hypothetical protein